MSSGTHRDFVTVPTSPTDDILSPISKKINSMKRIHSPQEAMIREKRRQSLDFRKAVVPTPFPRPSVEFILGTSSENRKQVIDLLQWTYRQISPDIDEKAIRTEDPMQLPLLIANAKADAVLERLREEGVAEEKIVLTADQIVLFEGQVREKPTSADEAKLFLSSYSNKSVSTVSAVVVTHYPSGIRSGDIDVATVYWDAISDQVVEDVVSRGVTFNCAGGFRIEDEALNPLILSVDGALDSILGMPVQLTLKLVDDIIQQVHEGCEISTGLFK
jgi:septum formation protein